MTTVRELVFGDHAGEVQAAERFAHDVSISEAAVKAVSQALEFEVADVLLWAWKTKSSLIIAARETYAKPGLVREVTLKTYAVPWDYEMHVDVLVNGVAAARVTFILTIELEVNALSATVRAGLLTGLGSGRFKASATLQAEGRMLAQRERVFDLVSEVAVGEGIALIPEAYSDSEPDSEPDGEAIDAGAA